MDTEVTKQKRVRCTDEKFLEAVFSSNTYAEIAEKTGQQVTTTMARYLRAKSDLAKRGIELPPMQRKKSIKTIDKTSEMAEIVQRLKAHHSGV